MSMQNKKALQNQTCPHFAIIFLDRQRNLCYQTSPSIAGNDQSRLSSFMEYDFRQAMERAGEFVAPDPCYIFPPSFSRFPTGNIPAPSRLASHSDVKAGIYSTDRTEPRSSEQPMMWPIPRGRGRLGEEPYSLSQQKPTGSFLVSSNHQTALISIRNAELLRRYYQKIFENLQQTNCRVLAKAYIKTVEPRKQEHFPYNGRKTVNGEVLQLKPDDTKPPWWPSGVSHREPDHLPKVERIRLLVHIFCELRPRYGITARKLKAADQSIRSRILPSDRLKTLDEAYRVREEEEKLWDGLIDGKAMVSISHENLPNKDQSSRPSATETRDLPSTNGSTDLEPEIVLIPSTRGLSGADPRQVQVDTGAYLQSQRSPLNYIHQDLAFRWLYDPVPASRQPGMRPKQQEAGSDETSVCLATTDHSCLQLSTDLETPTAGYYDCWLTSHPRAWY